MKTRTSNAIAGTRYNVTTAPVVCALIDFAAQNPGLDFANYGNHAAYGSEARSISADWRRVKAALMECAVEGVTDADVIAEAPHAFSGRLTWLPKQHTPAQTGADYVGAWNYCTGQYFPTEYRKAVASVLEQAAREARRNRPAVAMMPTTIGELKALNRANGSCWFEPSAMRFFGTRIEGGIIRGHYFVTSEQPPHGPRGYTLRSFDAKGDVDTVGELCGHASRSEAIAAIPAEEMACV